MCFFISSEMIKIPSCFRFTFIYAILIIPFTCGDNISIITRLGLDEFRKDLPSYNKSEVSDLTASTKKVLVIFKQGVYDVTDFVSKHPGGPRITYANGMSVKTFWEIYPVHYRKDVLTRLAMYRIGNLVNDDEQDNPTQKSNPFLNEPKRNPSVLTRTLTPFCGETPPSLLIQNYYTPNDLFYVRNHLPVPTVNVESYRLTIEGVGITSTSFSLSLQDIKNYPKVILPVTLECGGNRRTQMEKVRPAPGIPWTGGAMGNAVWGGASLKQVLISAGFKFSNYLNSTHGQIHFQFEGLDCDPFGDCYGSSVPLSFFFDPTYEPLLAYEMNHQDIPPDHGYPVRALFPGMIGARSVKWLGKIIVSNQESPSPWQQIDYKIFAPGVNDDNVDFMSAPPIYDPPLNSYICSHKDGDFVQQGMHVLRGYAYAGRGREIVRVELSQNNGNDWIVANLTMTGARWSWVHWEMAANLTQSSNVWVKAVDSGYNQQPEDFKNIWNYRGLVCNAYHKIQLIVKSN